MEKKKKSKIKLVLVVGFGIVGSCTISAIHSKINDKSPKREYPIYQYKNQPIVGKTINLNTDAKTYISSSNAMLKLYPSNVYFDDEFIIKYETMTGERLERIVIKAWYECGSNIEIIDMTGDYLNEESRIICNGGKLLAVETTVDKTNFESEGFYNVDDIKTKQIIKIKQ